MKPKLIIEQLRKKVTKDFRKRTDFNDTAIGPLAPFTVEPDYGLSTLIHDTTNAVVTFGEAIILTVTEAKPPKIRGR